MGHYDEGLYDKLNNYVKSDVYPFHMPGHKRNVKSGDSPYAYDITEIDGFDNLHHPRGILRASMDMATTFYGTKRTYYLVNGSTCGILASISASTSQGGTIIMARNCHKSVYNAVYMRQLTAHYVYPKSIEGMSMSGGIHPKDIENLLEEYPETEAVIITSPTYEGVSSYVSAIAKIVHRYGKVLIVDEAHGAHFSMHEYFPGSAIESGADAVIQSIHKTLPSLTQTALLHICSDAIDREKVERFLAIYQSSSPSYVLMSSVDGCIRGIFAHGTQIFDAYVEKLKVFREKTKTFTHIKLLDKSILGKSAAYDLDLGKIVIIVNSKRYTGHDVYEILLEKYRIQLEMAASDYVIAMTSMSDTDEGFDRLYQALEEIDRDIRINEGYGAMDSAVADEDKDNVIQQRKAVVCKGIYEALEAECELVDFKTCSGRISAEYIYLYPPGIPIVAPGEIVDATIIEYLLTCKRQGLDVQGLMDDSLSRIKVIKEDWKEFDYGKNILPDGKKFIGEGYHV